MTPTKEQISEALEYCTTRHDSCIDCHILALLEEDGEIECSRRAFAQAYCAKCAEVDELRKALDCKGCMHEGLGPDDQPCNLCKRAHGDMYSKALEGKE